MKADPTAEFDSRFSDPAAGPTPWSDVAHVLEHAELYWLTTVRADGRPHVTPLIAVAEGETVHFCTGLREQKARYAAVARNKANAARIIREAAAKQKALAREIDRLIQEQVDKGKIPSDFNGTFRWPMDSFNVSGEYGCSSFSWYAPGNGCAHYHNGIDLVAKYGTPIKSAAAGTVVYIGWNWADGADPAWIVVVAHSGSLRTWYAHMQPKRPVSVGQSVKKGQVIGYEGNTGNSTGAHLHWEIYRGNTPINPRSLV